MTLSRDGSRLAEWWFRVDRPLLAAVAVLMAAGLVLSFAASPWVALKKDLPAYYFVERHFAIAVLGAALTWAISLLSPVRVRQLALALFAAALAGMVAVDIAGVEYNGARRWLTVAGQSFQPSELIKPGLVVLIAWLLAEAARRADMPALPIAAVLVTVTAGLLAAQPDIGQAFLVCLVSLILFFLSGQPARRVWALAGCGIAGLAAAYLAVPHVRVRVDSFLAPPPGGDTQIGRAMRSFSEGGFLGLGPGEGTIKTVLPDAHTDFIFAVIAEEYGAVACLILLGIFGFIAVRALLRAARERDTANRLAISGLALLFGLQAFLNMAVTTGLLPAKGITLPLLSAGGSSLLGVSVTLGMLLALTGRRPAATRPDQVPA